MCRAAFARQLTLAAIALLACLSCAPSESEGGLVSAHLRVDHATSPGEKRAALQALKQALKTSLPADEAAALWLRQDGAYRMGQLYLELGETAAAEQAVSEGLALSAAASLPRANLLELKGRVFESLDNKQGAIEAYAEALELNQLLMREHLGAPHRAGEEKGL